MHAESAEFYESQCNAYILHAEFAELYESQGDEEFASGRFSGFCAFCVKKNLLSVKHSVSLPQMLRDVRSNQSLLPYLVCSEVTSETVEIDTQHGCFFR